MVNVNDKQILTSGMIRTLLGENAKNTLVYNFDRNEYNMEEYLGVPVADTVPGVVRLVRSTLMNMKQMLDQDYQETGYEIVASMIRLSNINMFWGGFKKSPEFDKNGRAVVANFIFRDLNIGKIDALTDNWLVINDSTDAKNGAQSGMYRLAHLVTSLPQIRRAVANMKGRTNTGR